MTLSEHPVRGEVWWVNFNAPPTAPSPPPNTPKAMLPTTGDEIYKTRPAVVMNISANWNLDLVMVVPITTWKDRFQVNRYFWMVMLKPDTANGLEKLSAANVFQFKSVSTSRLETKMGVLTTPQIDLIAATIAFCVGYTPAQGR
jgi:mRNA interferase MazF